VDLAEWRELIAGGGELRTRAVGSRARRAAAAAV
jgi:hypothetical protein